MYVVQEYTFTPGLPFEGTIEIPVVLKLEDFESITNATRGSVLYKPDEGVAGATVSYSGGSTILTLEQTTTYCQSEDELQIVVIGDGGTGPSQNVNVTNTALNPVPVSGSVAITNSSIEIANDAGNPVPVVDAKTDNSWITLRSWIVETDPLQYNTRPSAGQFQTVTGLTSSTMQLEVITKITTSPSASYRLYVWIDDGTEVYCVSPAGGSAGENGISSSDARGPFDGVAPVIVDLKRYTPTIKVAAIVCLDQAATVFDISGNCVNPGFAGGENVLLSSSALLPMGLSGRVTGVDATADTFTYTGTQLFNDDLVRINLSQIGTNTLPHLGLSARGRCMDTDIANDWLTLDGSASINLAVGDNIRFRAASGSSVLPSISGTVIAPGTSYTVTAISGNQFKISLDGVTTANITSPGVGLFYVFKFPYVYAYVKGSDQLSYSPGGSAIDFVAQHVAAPVTVTPGQTAVVGPITGTWVPRATGSTLDLGWNSVTWSPSLGLFAAVATGTAPNANKVMTSPDGINWTIRTAGANENWISITWSSSLSLFCAVSNSGSSVATQVMTSPDGVTWTLRSSAAVNTWTSIVWSSSLSLFVAVSNSGSGNRVMTSPNGITWTIRASAADNAWNSVTWSPSLGLFAAVSSSGAGNRVMTSPDGITWTSRTSAADNAWTSIVWSSSLSLFVAVSNTGTGNRVMTSPDGITWTSRTSASDNAWASIEWSTGLGLFVAVANGGTNRVMTSPDGVNWVTRVISDQNWNGVIWSPELSRLVAVNSSGVNNRVATSDASSYVAHGFASGRELILTANTTIPGGAFQGQRFYVKNPSTYSYSLSLTPGGPAVSFTSVGSGVQITDVTTGTATFAIINIGTPSSITLNSHWMGTLNRFTLGGSVLPGDYTDQTLYVVASPSILPNSFSFSENKLTPCVFSSSGSSVTLSANGTDWSDYPIERMTAFVANTPAPTDSTISFSYTSGGSAISLMGGVGSHSIVDAAAQKIRSGYVKARAM